MKCFPLQPKNDHRNNPHCDFLHMMHYKIKYCICSRNLRTFYSILATEKSGCVKYADFFCGGLDLGFILV